MTQTSTSSSNQAPWLWQTITVMVFVAVFLGRFAWPPLSHEAAADLNLSMASAGAFMSAFYVGYVITQLPGGMLADWLGAKRLLLACLFISGVATLAVTGIKSQEAGYAWRLLAGLGSGAVYSACMRATVSRFSGPSRNLAFGLMMMGPALGTLLPNIYVPVLSSMVGWRGVFAATGTATLVLAVVIWLVYPKDSATTVTAASEKSPPTAKPGVWAGLVYVLTNFRLVVLALIGFCLLWSYIGFVSWCVRFLIEDKSYDLPQATRIMQIFSVAILVSTPTVSALVTKFKRKELFLSTFFIGLALAVFVFGQVNSFGAFAATAILAGIGIGAGNVVLAILTAEYAAPQWAATAGGATGTIFQIGAIISPWLAGLSVDKTGLFGWVWIILAIPPIIGGLLLLYLGFIRKDN